MAGRLWIYHPTTGKTPLNSRMITNTDDATMVPSDLQAGVTAYARGLKIEGTGKSFEFALYGQLRTNTPIPIPTNINIIHVSSLDYPIQLSIALSDMKNVDFSTSATVGSITINDTISSITVSVVNNMLTVTCSDDIYLQVFYGKDNYV